MEESVEVSTQKLLAELWQKNQPLILERLAQLDEAAHASQSGTMPEELQVAAESTAHKLAGSLGMFGYHEGTNIARQLERELELAQPDAGRLAELTRSLRASLYPTTS